jgi:hypothetical protein
MVVGGGRRVYEKIMSLVEPFWRSSSSTLSQRVVASGWGSSSLAMERDTGQNVS